MGRCSGWSVGTCEKGFNGGVNMQIALSIMCMILSVLLIKKNIDYKNLWKAATEDNREAQKMIDNYERKIADLMHEIRFLEHEKEFMENDRCKKER